MTQEIEAIRTLADHFRSGTHDLRRDFFGPCFKYCQRYRRAAGYFSSTALLSWLTGISRLVERGEALQIDLIVSRAVLG